MWLSVGVQHPHAQANGNTCHLHHSSTYTLTTTPDSQGVAPSRPNLNLLPWHAPITPQSVWHSPHSVCWPWHDEPIMCFTPKPVTGGTGWLRDSSWPLPMWMSVKKFKYLISLNRFTGLWTIEYYAVCINNFIPVYVVLNTLSQFR